MTLLSELTSLVNRYGLDARHKTADHILAERMIRQLDTTPTITGLFSRGSTGAAGYDLYNNGEDVCLSASVGVVKVSTGVTCCLPQGYCGQLWCRSGLGSKGVNLHGGLIDSDYRGEVIVCLSMVGDNVVKIGHGERVAQLVIVPCLMPGLAGETERGASGFGSTGK